MKDTKSDIKETAQTLFLTKGYQNTSVNSIVETLGIAKGTFYHHFASKNDILSEIVDDLLETILSSAKQTAQDPALSPIEKIQTIISQKNAINQHAAAMKEALHVPENRELHEKINVQLVLKLSPIIAGIVDEGVTEGQFGVEHSLETVQFLLTASQFLFDDGLFSWNQEEWNVRRTIMQDVIEKSLGAQKGSFAFLSNDLS